MERGNVDLPRSHLGGRPMEGRRLEELACAARVLRRTRGCAIALSIGCNLVEWSQYLFGVENAFAHMAGAKKKFAAFLDRLTELHLDTINRILPPLRGHVDIVVFGDDLGTQRSPQISPRMYGELFLPRHREIYGLAKRLSGAHILLHSCGSIYGLIPDLIAAGVEILNPVQTSTRGMDPVRLKREFGSEITFWGGGCDTQTVLARGTPGEVRDDVRRRMEILMPGGGFVRCQIHNIMADVPPANIEAMLSAAREFGLYEARGCGRLKGP